MNTTGRRLSNSLSPILRDRSVGSWRVLGARPKPSAEIAVLVAGGRDELTVLTRPLTAGKWAFWGARRVVEVDLTEHRQILRLELPSAMDVPPFLVQVEIWWKVFDAVTVVRCAIQDVGKLYLSHVMPALRRTARKYSHDRTGAAEEALSKELERHRRLDGVEICRAVVQVSRDDAVIARQMETIQESHHNDITSIRHTRIKEFDVQGSTGVLSYYLTQNPDDAMTVVRELAEREQIELTMAMEIVLNAVRTGNLQQIEVNKIREDAMQRILRHVVSKRPDRPVEREIENKEPPVAGNAVDGVVEPAQKNEPGKGDDDREDEDDD